jgi:signal transduction histidine kinase
LSVPAILRRLWPRSLQGQLLLAVAAALLLAQAISAVLLYRAGAERREAALVHAAAIRLFAAQHEQGMLAHLGRHPPDFIAAAQRLKVERAAENPLRPGESRRSRAEQELREILSTQGIAPAAVVVVERPLSEEPGLARRIAHRAEFLGRHRPHGARKMMLAAVELDKGKDWMVVRMPVPPGDRALSATLIAQTLLLYALLVGAIALILGRMTRPLAALTARLDRFAETRDVSGQLDPQGPDDLRRLIAAHNAMEDRIAALLDEKDVMLGAIGHDLKTPLAALRVRIESVEDEGERAKMAATIEDITRSLDDILSLARVGRPSDPREPAELAALIASLVDEYEDMGEPVTFADAARLAAPVRVTWLRRALRNLIGNALRYGQTARLSLAREGENAVIRVEDDGPGIAEERIAEMLEPFTRGEPSRNSETGGAGLGLTLARAIAEQHGGTLELANRRGSTGQVAGLTATLTLPLT